MFCEQKGCEVVELNVQDDHVHLIVMMPPKVSVSDLIGTLKGRSAIRIFKQRPGLKTKLYWGNHFWAPGYCVDTVGLNEDMIRKYVRYQEKKELEAE
jgi:putative transposase